MPVSRETVSILLVLEIGLDENKIMAEIRAIGGFNPSCAGNWLRRLMAGNVP